MTRTLAALCISLLWAGSAPAQPPPPVRPAPAQPLERVLLEAFTAACGGADPSFDTVRAVARARGWPPIIRHFNERGRPQNAGGRRTGAWLVEERDGAAGHLGSIAYGQEEDEDPLLALGGVQLEVVDDARTGRFGCAVTYASSRPEAAAEDPAAHAAVMKGLEAAFGGPPRLEGEEWTWRTAYPRSRSPQAAYTHSRRQVMLPPRMRQEGDSPEITHVEHALMRLPATPTPPPPLP